MKKILLLDNHKINRNITRKVLEKNSFIVYESDNGEEGIELMAKHHPDMVLTDLFMPQLGGIEIIKHIARHYPGTPIIATCRFKEAPYLKVAKHLGASSGICRPFSEAELLSVIRQSLSTAAVLS